ncbi:hypothetical protein I0P12_18665, partial [Acinetobacter baumannii]|uniref:hypothetical protein n=1 Tax=Acinetobacter baumannii TaxID=470 RepID=UPI001A125448
IDTATTKTGMSGSAVFIKSNGFTFPKGKENIDDMIMSQCYTFGGVYSGRSQLIHSGSSIYPDLAIVWKESGSLFPVGELEKPQVRKIAEELDLITAKKK